MDIIFPAHGIVVTDANKVTRWRVLKTECHFTSSPTWHVLVTWENASNPPTSQLPRRNYPPPYFPAVQNTISISSNRSKKRGPRVKQQGDHRLLCALSFYGRYSFNLTAVVMVHLENKWSTNKSNSVRLPDAIYFHHVIYPNGRCTEQTKVWWGR